MTEVLCKSIGLWHIIFGRLMDIKRVVGIDSSAVLTVEISFRVWQLFCLPRRQEIVN